MASRLTSSNTSRLPVPNLKQAPASKMGAVGGTKGPPRRVLGDITKQNLQNVNNSKLVAKPVLAKPTLNNTALARPRLTRQAVRRLSVPPKVEDTVQVDYTEQAKSLAPPPGVVDIDLQDQDDPQLCSEYAKEIFVYLRSLEPRGLVREKHLLGCPSNEKMREVLVDWLVEVQLQFQLLQETLFVTISILDRYLAVEGLHVNRTKLQLVGVTAMFIASKMEEVYAPSVKDFVYITDNAYTEADLMKTEIAILRALKFDLFQPISLHFLRRFSKAADVDVLQHNIAKYALEVGLLDYTLVCKPGSLVAAAALYLSLLLTNESENDNVVWSPTLNYYCNYTRDEVLPTVVKLAGDIIKGYSRENRTKAVKNKYQSSKYLKVSDLPVVKGEKLMKLAKLKIPPQ